MNPAERCMHVFGHAMAAYTLYGPGHQARSEASGRLFRVLEELLAADRRPTFTFLDDAVIYGALPVHGLRGWVWGRRLGAQRDPPDGVLFGDDPRRARRVPGHAAPAALVGADDRELSPVAGHRCG